MTRRAVRQGRFAPALQRLTARSKRLAARLVRELTAVLDRAAGQPFATELTRQSSFSFPLGPRPASFHPLKGILDIGEFKNRSIFSC